MVNGPSTLPRSYFAAGAIVALKPGAGTSSELTSLSASSRWYHPLQKANAMAPSNVSTDRTKPTVQGRSCLAVMAAFLGLMAGCSAALQRWGLFSNDPSFSRALALHNRAWERAGLSRPDNRQQISELVRDYDALRKRTSDCSTDERNYKKVYMHRPIPKDLHDGSPTIDCLFVVFGAWPFDFFTQHSWVVKFSAKDEDSLEVVGVTRNVHFP